MYRLLVSVMMTVFCLTCGTVLGAFPGYGQKNLEEEVTVSFEQVPLRKALEQLQQEYELSMTYRASRLPESPLVTYRGSKKLKYILQDILRPYRLTYRIEGGFILLMEKPEEKLTLPVTGQQRAVSGNVTDENGRPLPEVSVRIEGSTQGTTTDTSGSYEVTGISGETVLVFSFVGYRSQEITAGSRQEIDVSLTPDLAGLEEVIVVGYGSVKKSSVTAAISKVENTNLDQFPAGRPETALVGRMAGVNISTTRNNPGEAPVIRVRGAGSISASNDPLVVIDGFPGGSLANISMNDVESIEVLKDASSAAIYGSRGSGGVIIVTTKKGKSGSPKLNFNAYTGILDPQGYNDWIQGEEYYDYVVRYQNREFVWAGGDPSIPVWGDPRRPPQYQVNPVIKEGNENWQDNVLKTGLIQNYNLSVRGGTDKVRYYISGTLKDEEGTVINTWYKNYAIRANLDVNINPVFSTGLMINPNFSERRVKPLTMEAMVKMPPFVSSERNPDGTYPRARDYWGAVVSGGLNPMGILEGTENISNAMNGLGEMYLGVNILKGLSFKSTLGANITYGTNDYYQAFYANSNGEAAGSASDSRLIVLLNENVLNYQRDFKGDHSLNAILGASYQKSESRNAALSTLQGSFGNDIIKTLNNAIISPSGSYTRKSVWGLVSYFSRINYGYRDKYLLAASLRTDGSSRFGSENRWGYFPSASIAWRVSEEDFMREIPAVSELKLRASYGVVGNFNIGDFQYLGTIADVSYSPNNELAKGAAQASLGNPRLGWEETRSYDFGLELSLFDYRLNMVLDYYNKSTTNLLYNISIPATTGFTSTISNVGDISNSGIELEINSRNLTGKFTWETSFNLTANRNKVVDLGGLRERIFTQTYGMSWLLRVGEPMFSYYGYKAIGVLQNEEDVANSPVMPGSKPGNTKYQDTDGDGEITPRDRVILGNFQPKVYLGMVNDFSFRNFDLNIVIQSSLGAKMYNFEHEYYQGALAGAMRRSLVETQWWSEEEPGDGRMPGAALSNLTFQSNSDIYIEDASFLAVRNVNLGYTFPTRLVERLKLDRLRVYASVSNLVMITKDEFHSYNPEGYTFGEIDGINSMPGFNAGSEPINRIFTLGINLGF